MSAVVDCPYCARDEQCAICLAGSGELMEPAEIRSATAAAWAESKHRRWPAGTPGARGGEFAPKTTVGVSVSYDRARHEFDRWAEGMAQWYTEKDGFAPDYFPTQRDELWRQYQESVDTALPALRDRLVATGVSGVVIEPELSSADGGDLDALMDPERTHSPDFNVEMRADPDAHPDDRPGFTVWTFEDGTIEVEDVVPTDDRAFFPGGPESETAAQYVALIDAARGTVPDNSTVTIYRGMSDAERDAWDRGDEIPAGKFFTDQPTSAYAQDISGAPPSLHTFEIPRSMLVEVAPGEFQLRQRARETDGRIEAVTSAARAPLDLDIHMKEVAAGAMTPTREGGAERDESRGDLPEAVRPPLTSAAWEESKHPRHPRGDDRGGEFAPKSTFVGKQGFDRGPGRVVIEGERPRIPTSEVFAHEWRELDQAVSDWAHLREMDPQTEMVPVSELVPTQDVMSAVRIQEYVQELQEDGNLDELLDSVRVVEGDDGRYYIADGHNRVAAAIELGHRSLPLPVLRADHGNQMLPAPTTFPPGEFDPTGPVTFWPREMGAYSGFVQDAPYGPFWKALADKDGNELAFWFASTNGYPHHGEMQHALGQVPSDRVWMTYSGYGTTGEEEWTGRLSDLGGTTRAGHVAREREIIERHRRDIRDANEFLPENQKERALAAAAWDESAHPRHPRGSDRGGEFAAKGFPKGILDLDDSAVFWPEKIGLGSDGEPLWKAIINDSGEEVAFWFADDLGKPHHASMEPVLGVEPWSGTQLAGTGDNADTAYQRLLLKEHPVIEHQAEDIYRLVQEEESHALYENYNALLGDYEGMTLDEIKQDLINERVKVFEQVPRRHRRDIQDAREIVQGQSSMAAAAGPPTVASFNELVDQGRERMDGFEPRLTRVYRGVIRELGRNLAKRFGALSNPALAAAAEPAAWTPPTVAQLVANVQIEEAVAEANAEIRRKAFEQMVNGILIRLGIRFDITSILSQALLNGLAARAEEIMEGIRVPVARVIANSYVNGLSVPQTADAIIEAVDGIAEWQAVQLARNDLVGLANGGSLLSARIVQERFPEIGLAYKEWLSTPDERTRPTHVEANGQRVPLETPFVVGDATLAYPGDPSGPDGEVINCRCTVLFREEPLTAAAWDESKHPRHPAGSELGGEFAPKGSYYHGAMIARDENDKPIGYQAFRMDRRFGGKHGGRTDAGPVRETYQEAAADAMAAQDAEEAATPLVNPALTEAVDELRSQPGQGSRWTRTTKPVEGPDGEILRGTRGALQIQAAEAGVPIEEYDDWTTTRLQELTSQAAGARVAIRTDSIDAILERGEYVNAFDPNHNLGDQRGDRSSGYLGSRAAVEARLFGEGNHPIYGYVALDDEDLDTSLAKAFGQQAKITLKDDVRARTTVTYSDSMFIDAGAPNSDVIPRPINEVDHRSVASWMNLGGVEVPIAYKGEKPRPAPEPPDELVKRWEREMPGYWKGEDKADYIHSKTQTWLQDEHPGYVRWEHGDFIEAQIHGGVTVDDIERIDFAEPPSQATIDRLNELGLAWTVGGP